VYQITRTVVNAKPISSTARLSKEPTTISPICFKAINLSWSIFGAPVFQDVAAERKGKVRFIKINTEIEQQLAAQFQIRSIPTVMVFKNGQRVDVINGALPKSQFDQWLNQALIK